MWTALAKRLFMAIKRTVSVTFKAVKPRRYVKKEWGARNLYLFVPTRKFFHRRKCLIRNGGDDETRTRDLCRDTLHSVGWVVGWKISRSSLKMFPSFCFKSESVSSTAGGTANFPQWVGWVKRPIVEGR